MATPYKKRSRGAPQTRERRGAVYTVAPHFTESIGTECTAVPYAWGSKEVMPTTAPPTTAARGAPLPAEGVRKLLPMLLQTSSTVDSRGRREDTSYSDIRQGSDHKGMAGIYVNLLSLSDSVVPCFYDIRCDMN